MSQYPLPEEVRKVNYKGAQAVVAFSIDPATGELVPAPGASGPAIVVADKTARKLLSTYSGLDPAVVPYAGMRVVQTDENVGGYPTVEYLLNGTDVSVDGSWFLGNLANPVTGATTMDLRLIDGTGIVLPAGALARIGSALRLGDGATTGGKATAFADSDSSVICHPGDDVAASYARASALTPNGSALSTTNRATWYVLSGTYPLTVNTTFDTEFVDIVGIGEVLFSGSTGFGESLFYANDARVRNIRATHFRVNSSCPLSVFVDCSDTVSGFNRHDGGAVLSGTYIRCKGVNNDFGAPFGTSGCAGLFIECEIAGGGFAKCTGTFIRCRASGSGFGADSTSSATIIDCEGGAGSFSDYHKLYGCRLTSGAFTARAGSGVIVNGIDGNNNSVNTGALLGIKEGVVALGTVTTTKTISIDLGSVITAILTASTACTFTMPTATAGKSFRLQLKQAAATGNGTATFTGVKWDAAGAPVVTPTAGKMDIFYFESDGTNWYGSVSKGFTP